MLHRKPKNEVLTNEEKFMLIHGFITGLMVGHCQIIKKIPPLVADYMGIENELIDSAQINDLIIDENLYTKLSEFDILTMYMTKNFKIKQ